MSIDSGADWFGDIFTLPEGMEDFLLEEPVDGVMDYDDLINIQDVYIAEGAEDYLGEEYV